MFYIFSKFQYIADHFGGGGPNTFGFFPILMEYNIQWLLLIFFTICYMLIDTALQKIDEYIFKKIEELDY